MKSCELLTCALDWDSPRETSDQRTSGSNSEEEQETHPAEEY